MYELSKDRFLELKHHCLQVPFWEGELVKVTKKIDIYGEDPTGEEATWIAELKRRIDIVDKTLKEAFAERDYMKGYYAVTKGLRFPPSFPEYEMLRKFYWLLDKKL